MYSNMNEINNHISLLEKIGLYSFAASSHDLSIQVLSTTLLFSLLIFNNKFIKTVDKRYIIIITFILLISGLIILVSALFGFIGLINSRKINAKNFLYSIICYFLLIIVYIIFFVVAKQIYF